MDTPFAPTHVVAPAGAMSWESSDRPPVPLAPGLPVQVLEHTDGWAKFLCSNGWGAWVDPRQLAPVASAPPAEPELAVPVAELAQAMDAYTALIAEFDAGGIDPAEFRRRAVRTGMHVTDEHAWILDAVNGRWLLYDGATVHDVSEAGPTQ